MTTLRVATWNINLLRLRLPLVERLVTALNPDVICLQETKVPDELFPDAAPGAFGYSHVARRGSQAETPGRPHRGRVHRRRERCLTWKNGRGYRVVFAISSSTRANACGWEMKAELPASKSRTTVGLPGENASASRMKRFCNAGRIARSRRERM